MAVLRRTIGFNILECLKQKNITLEAFAEKMRYSAKDVQNLIEGKVIVSPTELDRIAEYLGTTEYVLPDLRFMKKFSNPDNLDMIIDLMDEYVECREAVDSTEA